MAACSVKLLSFLVFIHVLRVTTASRRKDTERETQHNMTDDITQETSTDPSDITRKQSFNIYDLTMKISADAHNNHMNSSTNSKNNSMENSTDPSEITYPYDITLTNTTDSNDTLKIWKLFFSKWHQLNLTQKLHNSGQTWYQILDKITFGNLEYTKTAFSVRLYCSPILLVLGTIGNILSLAVMLRKNIRESTTSLYLSVLAIADTAVLYTGLLMNYVIKLSGYYIFDSSRFACKFGRFTIYGLQQFDSWVLVNVALERVCAVFLPHKVKDIFTKKFATVSLIIQGLVIIAINNHFFYTYDLVYHAGEFQFCDIQLPAHASFIDYIWPWIDFCLISLIPFTIIISSNVAIVCRLLRSRYKRRHLHVNSQVKMTSMTAVLITVSLMFLVTTAPLRIFTITLNMNQHKTANVYQKATLSLVSAILNMILYINYSVNFLLYCVSGTRFREELKAMCCCIINPIQTRSVPNIEHTSTTL